MNVAYPFAKNVCKNILNVSYTSVAQVSPEKLVNSFPVIRSVHVLDTADRVNIQ